MGRCGSRRGNPGEGEVARFVGVQLGSVSPIPIVIVSIEVYCMLAKLVQWLIDRGME